MVSLRIVLVAAAALFLLYFGAAVSGVARFKKINVYCDSRPYSLSYIHCDGFYLHKKMKIVGDDVNGLSHEREFYIPMKLLDGFGSMFHVGSILMLKIPINTPSALQAPSPDYEKHSFKSWVFLRVGYGNEGKSFEKHVSQFLDEERYHQESKTNDFLQFKQISPDVSYTYWVPSQHEARNIYFRCEKLCTASTFIGGVYIDFSIPFEELHNYRSYQSSITSLIESFYI